MLADAELAGSQPETTPIAFAQLSDPIVTTKPRHVAEPKSLIFNMLQNCPSRFRTWNLLIQSQTLCQLS